MNSLRDLVDAFKKDIADWRELAAEPGLAEEEARNYQAMIAGMGRAVLLTQSAMIMQGLAEQERLNAERIAFVDHNGRKGSLLFYNAPHESGKAGDK